MVLCVSPPLCLCSIGVTKATQTQEHILPRAHASSNFLVHLRSSSIEYQTQIELCFVMVSLLA